VLHRAAYTALGLSDWRYDRIDCDTPQLADLLATHRPPQWRGFSCTMPLKHAVLELADEIDPLADIVGSANTLLPRPGGWYAASTDVAGIAGALDEREVDARTVTLLGAGGTAQAAVAALAGRGITSCTVLVRDRARAARLLATAQRLHVQVDLARLHLGAPGLAADLVISTLPPGVADALAIGSWRAGQALLDVVYHPWPTRLAEAMVAAGASVAGGALVLLHQAVEQVQLMTGFAAPVEAMRDALAAAVPGGRI
jgi:shikimate dehydrogenase